MPGGVQEAGSTRKWDGSKRQLPRHTRVARAEPTHLAGLRRLLQVFVRLLRRHKPQVMQQPPHQRRLAGIHMASHHQVQAAALAGGAGELCCKRRIDVTAGVMGVLRGC